MATCRNFSGPVSAESEPVQPYVVLTVAPLSPRRRQFQACGRPIAEFWKMFDDGNKCFDCHQVGLSTRKMLMQLENGLRRADLCTLLTHGNSGAGQTHAREMCDALLQFGLSSLPWSGHSPHAGLII